MPDEPEVKPIAEGSIAEICREFERSWESSGDSVEAFLKARQFEHPVPRKLIARLVKCEIEFLRQNGRAPSCADYQQRFPQLPGDVLDDLMMMPAFPPAASRRTRTPLLPSRYRVVEMIGKGGIGSVWRVEDRTMQRPLAAKVLLEKFRHNDAANARLEREALLAGSLQHPGIPPVFEQGELAGGSRFFTMKLVEGHTLDALLKRRGQPDDDRQYFLGVFRQVAEAIGFAHAQGVIHRDLKPQNVMVGEFGEVQIMDWGMAKRLGQTATLPSTSPDGFREPARRVPSAEPDVRQEALESRPMSIDSSLVDGQRDALTLHGDVFGTPAYMPPEQARGILGQLGERSDVFALGAILFEILTLHRLYDEFDLEQLLDAAAEYRIEASFKQLDACGADPELVALCKHCLSRDPEARPANGLAVAVAISEHLSGVEQRLKATELEMVASEARASEARERLKTIVALVAAVAVVSIVGLTGIAWKWREANQNYRESLRQSAARDGYFSKSLEAVDLMLTRVGSSMLVNVPQMSEVRSQLLTDALGFYNELLEDSPDDPALRREFGRIKQKVGSIESQLGDQEHAIAAFQEAAETFSGLRDEFPEDRMLLVEFCAARRLYAVSIHAVGDSARGEAVLREVIQSLDPASMLEWGLDPSQPEYVPWLQVRADAHSSLARILPFTNGGTAAIEEFERAVGCYELIPESESTESLRFAYAQSLDDLASFLERVNRIPRATELRNDAIEILDQLLEQNPESADYRSLQANVRQTLCGFLARQGKLRESIEGFGQAIEQHRQLIADFPGFPKLKQDFARCLAQFGAALNDHGDFEQAQQAFTEAVTFVEQLVQRYPGTVEYLQELGYVCQSAGTAYYLVGGDANQKLGLEYQARGYEAGKSIVELAPANTLFHYDLAIAARNMASSVWRVEKDRDAALRLLEEAMERFANISDLEPENTDYLYQLAFTGTNYAGMLPPAEQAKAMLTMEKALETLGRLIELQPESPRYRHQLARAYDQLAGLKRQAGDPAGWEALLRKANQTTEEVLEKFGASSRNVTFASISRNRLAHCLDAMGKAEESLPLFQRALHQRQQAVDNNPEPRAIEGKVRQLASSHANVAWNLAYWQPPENRDLEEALRHAVLANELDVEAAEHWTCRAYIQFAQANYNEVDEVLSRCEAVNPPDQMARLALQAMTHWQQGERDAARAKLAEALEMRDTTEVQSDTNAILTSPEFFRLVEDADQLIDP